MSNHSSQPHDYNHIIQPDTIRNPRSNISSTNDPTHLSSIPPSSSKITSSSRELYSIFSSTASNVSRCLFTPTTHTNTTHSEISSCTQSQSKSDCFESKTASAQCDEISLNSSNSSSYTTSSTQSSSSNQGQLSSMKAKKRAINISSFTESSSRNKRKKSSNSRGLPTPKNTLPTQTQKKPVLSRAEKLKMRHSQKRLIQETSFKFKMYSVNDGKKISVYGNEICPSDNSSWVWTHFQKFNNPSLKNFVSCNLCRQGAIDSNDDLSVNYAVNYGDSKSTSKLAHHLKDFHLASYQTHIQNMHDQKLSGSQVITTHLTSDKYDSEYHSSVMKWVVMCGIPFCMVNDIFFRRMMRVANRKLPDLNRQGLVCKLQDKAFELKAVVSKMLEGQFLAITTDGWTSSQLVSYLALTAHYITADWKLHAISLSCSAQYGSSTAADHVTRVLDVLNTYKIPTMSVVAAVTDTENTMGSFGNIMQRDQNISWTGCFDHRIQLITKLAFDDANLPGADFAMKRARDLIAFFSHSTQATDLLRRIQKTQKVAQVVNLLPDIVTKWWSTFSMLERIMRLRPYITMAIEQSICPREYQLHEEQWCILYQVMKVLEPFRLIQQHMEGEKYVSISLVPVFVQDLRIGLQKILNNLDNNITSPAVMHLTKILLSKSLKGIPDGLDRERIWVEVKTRCRLLTIPAVLIPTAIDQVEEGGNA